MYRNPRKDLLPGFRDIVKCTNFAPAKSAAILVFRDRVDATSLRRRTAILTLRAANPLEIVYGPVQLRAFESSCCGRLQRTYVGNFREYSVVSGPIAGFWDLFWVLLLGATARV